MASGKQTSAVLARLRRLGGLVRDAWLIFGLALAFLFVAEVAYRVQGAIRAAALARIDPDAAADDPASTPLFPYSDAPWYEPWEEARDEAFQNQFVIDPYRGRRMLPVSLPGLTVDSLGMRMTPGGAVDPARRVVMLAGGSTMWGYSVRDSATIPAGVAGALRAGGHDSIAVLNVAQISYNIRQELATIQELVQRGRVPDLVVFLDGVNEVGPFFNGEPPGSVYAYRSTLQQLRLGSRSLGEELLGIGRHLQLVQRLQVALAPPSQPGSHIDDLRAVCSDAAERYLFYARRAADLGEQYGFSTVFVMQPLLATSTKRLGPWERYVVDRDRDSVLPDLLRECSETFRGMFEANPEIRWEWLVGVFHDRTDDIFLDQFGHVTEEGSRIMADSLARIVESYLVERSMPPPFQAGDPS